MNLTASDQHFHYMEKGSFDNFGSLLFYNHRVILVQKSG